MDKLPIEDGEKTEKIRVLIVDNNPETREKTRTLLGQEKDIEILGAAKTGREAIDLSQDSEPDVVVLDVNTPDMDEIAITEAICRRVPFAQILILAVQVDPNYMRRAMLAGARDFIVKPPLADELRSAVYRAGGLAQERRASSMRILPHMSKESEPTRPQAVARGKVIQVYGAKGGVGTTTLAANLAVALQSPTSKAVLVDGNLQYGDVAIYLNEVGYHSILDLTSRINDLDPDTLASVLVTHAQTGLDIMVAPNRPEMAEKVSGEEFFKVIQYLRRLYSYVIVDTPTALGEITLSTLDAADVLLLVTTQEIPAVKNTRLFLSILDGLHISRQRIVFAINRYDRQVAISPEKVGENLKQEVAAIIPLELKTALRAENQGKPFVLDKKDEPISKAVLDLAEIVKNQLTAVANADPNQLKVLRQNA